MSSDAASYLRTTDDTLLAAYVNDKTTASYNVLDGAVNLAIQLG